MTLRESRLEKIKDPLWAVPIISHAFKPVGNEVYHATTYRSEMIVDAKNDLEALEKVMNLPGYSSNFNRFSKEDRKTMIPFKLLDEKPVQVAEACEARYMNEFGQYLCEARPSQCGQCGVNGVEYCDFRGEEMGGCCINESCDIPNFIGCPENSQTTYQKKRE